MMSCKKMYKFYLSQYKFELNSKFIFLFVILKNKLTYKSFVRLIKLSTFLTKYQMLVASAALKTLNRYNAKYLFS